MSQCENNLLKYDDNTFLSKDVNTMPSSVDALLVIGIAVSAD